MSYIIRVLKRVLVDEFYRTHAGLFLIVLGICFGFMSGNEHMALAQFFTGSPLLALIPIAGWLLYAIIIVSFNRIELTKPENNFLLTLVELSPGMRWFALISTSAQAFLPAALYGLFLIKIAFSVRQFSSIVVIVAGCVALILLIALDLHHNLLRPGRERKTGLLKRITNRYVTKPFAWFYPEWITRAQPLMVFGTKLFSCLIIAGVGILYHYDTYDQRFFQMACVLAISANMVLVYHYHRFENVHLIMLRSLPFSLPQRMTSFLITMLLLLVPELATLINYFPEAVSKIHLVYSIVFCISMVLMAYAFLFRADLILDVFIQYLFAASFALILLVLFKVSVMFLAALNLVIGVYWYRKHFYTFEPTSENSSLE